jgi:hypothetical protein
MMFRPSLGAPVRAPVLAVFVVALIALGAAGRAQAQLLGTGGTGATTGTAGTTGNGSTFSASDFFIGAQQTQGVNLSAFDVARFFDKAHCDCSTPVYVFIAILPQSVSKRTAITSAPGSISVVLGPDCTDVLTQSLGNCILLAREPVLTFLNDTSYTIPTNARALSTYLNPTGFILDAGIDAGPDAATVGTSTGPCSSTVGQFNQTVNVLIDFDGDGVSDVTVTSALLIDLTPPPQPAGVTIEGGDEALIMHWTAIDTSVVPDLLGYQVLCSRADQYQVFSDTSNLDGGGSSGPFGAGFLTCPATRTGTGVEGLDPTFACSPLLSAEATSYRVKILQNDITYAASVVAVDNSGNASQPIVGYGTPIKTLSFYEVYRNGNPQDPGAASGGCALAIAKPGVKSTLGALLAFGMIAAGVAVARRRRGRR